MNAFTEASAVEQAALPEIAQWIQEHCDGGHLVFTHDGAQRRIIQKLFGDVIAQKNGEVLCIEIKVEEHTTGNLFLETWSNLSMFTPGWMYTLNADILMYYFRDEKTLHTLSMPKLRQWCFQDRQIYRFKEVQQSKYKQLNDTWGRLVRVADLERHCDMKTHKLS